MMQHNNGQIQTNCLILNTRMQIRFNYSRTVCEEKDQSVSAVCLCWSYLTNQTCTRLLPGEGYKT